MKTYMGRFTLQWHITHRCNLRCAHCYQEDYQHSAAYEELIEVLDKYQRFCLKHSYAPQINLTGGEPFTHPELFRLLKEISDRGIPFSVLTNATLIDELTASRLAVYNPIWVQVSLDGNRGIHEKIRGRGSFDRALAGIDELKHSGIPVLVSFTAQKHNAGSFLSVALTCKEHHVDLLWWDRVVSEDEELILSAKQFRRLNCLSGILHRIIKNDRGNPMVGCGRSLQFLSCPESPGYVCSAGRSLAAVLADGSVMPCRRLPYVIGNIRDDELDEILNESPIVQSLRTTGTPEECGGCPHAKKCAGGSRCVSCARTGSPFVKDPDCCFTETSKRH